MRWNDWPKVISRNGPGSGVGKFLGRRLCPGDGVQVRCGSGFLTFSKHLGVRVEPNGRLEVARQPRCQDARAAPHIEQPAVPVEPERTD